MKRLFILICLLFHFSNSICQNLHFSPNIIFGYNVDVYKPCALSIDDYGNKYIIGDMQYNFNILNTGFNSNQLHNYYLLKLSANDSLIWLKIIATGDWQTSLPTNFSLSLDMNDMPVIAYTYFDSVASFGNNYYSPGFIDPNTNQYVSIYKNINLCKLDTAGNLLWQKSIIGNFDEDITSKCLDIDNENNIIIIGSFGGGVAFPPYTDTAFCDFGGITLASAVPKMFIVKYNPSGNLIWARNDGGENTSGTSIASDSFSNYYIIGQLPIADAWFDTIHILFPAIYNAVTFIAKYNKNGKAIWVRYFAVDGLADQISNNSILFYNNNILVAGGYACNSNQVVHFENITLANPSGFTNGYITSLDTFGNLLWVKNIFNNFAGDVSHSRLAIDSSNIYFTSSFKGTVCINSDTLHSNGIWDLLISKMDSVGNAITNNSIKGNLNESIQGIEFDSSNDLYILGTTNSNFMEFDNLNTNPTGASNIYLAKLSKTPTFIQGIEKASFKIYPNPAIDKIFIESYSGEEIKIDLFNIFYQKIYSSTNKRSIFTINCSSFNSGLYFFKITEKNKMYQQKIIIQH